MGSAKPWRRIPPRPPADDGQRYEQVHDAFEKAVVAHVLGLTAGNQVQAANQLGIHRTTLRKLIDKYGL